MFKMSVVRKRRKKLPPRISGPSKVKVGFPAGEADSDNIQKAVWNEFGTRGGASGGGWGGPVPERPFMRNAVKNNTGGYQSAMRASAVKILRGETSMTTVLRKLGIKAQGDIQAEISSLTSPGNADATIALKGSDKPLIDTGEMRAAVTYMVDD